MLLLILIRKELMRTIMNIYTAKIFFLPDMLRTALQIQFLITITITITKKELLNLNLKVLIMNLWNPGKIALEVLNYGMFMKE